MFGLKEDFQKINKGRFLMGEREGGRGVGSLIRFG